MLELTKFKCQALTIQVLLCWSHVKSNVIVTFWKNQCLKNSIRHISSACRHDESAQRENSLNRSRTGRNAKNATEEGLQQWKSYCDHTVSGCIRTCHKIGFTFACVLSFNEARTTRLRPSRGQMFEAKAEAKALRPRPKFWPRDRFGLETLSSLGINDL